MGVAGWRDPEEGKGREGIISDTGPHGHPYHGPLVESRVLILDEHALQLERRLSYQ